MVVPVKSSCGTFSVKRFYRYRTRCGSVSSTSSSSAFSDNSDAGPTEGEARGVSDRDPTQKTKTHEKAKKKNGKPMPTKRKIVEDKENPKPKRNSSRSKLLAIEPQETKNSVDDSPEAVKTPSGLQTTATEVKLGNCFFRFCRGGIETDVTSQDLKRGFNGNDLYQIAFERSRDTLQNGLFAFKDEEMAKIKNNKAKLFLSISGGPSFVLADFKQLSDDFFMAYFSARCNRVDIVVSIENAGVQLKYDMEDFE